MTDIVGVLDESGGECDEDGFTLTLTTDDGDTMRVRVGTDAARELLEALVPMRDRIAEHDHQLAAYNRASLPDRAFVLRRVDPDDPDSGYALGDPKHPTYHERMVD